MIRIFLAVLACVLLQYPFTAAAVPEQTITSGVNDFPDYRIDAGGNLHLVWYDASMDNGAIMYTMQDSAGTTLINPVQVNTGGTGNANTWPTMAVVSGLVYIAWQNTNDNEVWFIRLNPSLGPPDSVNPVVPAATIREVEMPISTAGGTDAIHPRMDGESGGILHIVWESAGGGTVEYIKVDTDGTVLNGPVALGGVSNGAGLPDVDVDSNGDAHVVFANAASTADDEVYYTMVDGATGAILIDATLLTVDDGLRAGNATVNVDSFDDSLFIVFKQALVNMANGAEEVFMVRVDPALDDQDGSTASPAVIKGTEYQVSNGEGAFQWFVTSRIGQDNRIHALYMDYDGINCPATGYPLVDAHITFSGTVVVRNTLTTTGSTTSCFPQARIAPRRNRIVWPDSTTPGTTEILSEFFSRVETGSSGFLACSLGNRDAVAWRSGELWLLLGLVVLLGARRFRRPR